MRRRYRTGETYSEHCDLRGGSTVRVRLRGLDFKLGGCDDWGGEGFIYPWHRPSLPLHLAPSPRPPDHPLQVSAKWLEAPPHLCQHYPGSTRIQTPKSKRAGDPYPPIGHLRPRWYAVAQGRYPSADETMSRRLVRSLATEDMGTGIFSQYALRHWGMTQVTGRGIETWAVLISVSNRSRLKKGRRSPSVFSQLGIQ